MNAGVCMTLDAGGDDMQRDAKAANPHDCQPCQKLRDKIPRSNLKTKSICMEAKFHQSVKYSNPPEKCGLRGRFRTHSATFCSTLEKDTQ